MGKKKPNSSCIPAEMYSGMDLLGGGTPLALARGGAIFHDKAKNY
jgi:hypothetical protein